MYFWRSWNNKRIQAKQVNLRRSLVQPPAYSRASSKVRPDWSGLCLIRALSDQVLKTLMDRDCSGSLGSLSHRWAVHSVGRFRLLSKHSCCLGKRILLPLFSIINRKVSERKEHIEYKQKVSRTIRRQFQLLSYVVVSICCFCICQANTSARN